DPDVHDDHGRISVGAGWFARPGVVGDSAGAARAEYDRLVTWMADLGESLSPHRCVVLCSAEPHRFCPVQLVRRTPSLDSLVVGAFDPGLSGKRIINLLARAAAMYLLALSELERLRVLVPIRLGTVTRVDRRTVFTDFLPAAPIEPSGEDHL